MLKYLVFSFFNLLLVTISLGQNAVQINQPYKFNTWISVRDSLRAARGVYDLTLQLPTGCGTPVGIGSLNGGDKNKSAFYYDSCTGKLFVYNPKNITWDSALMRIPKPTWAQTLAAGSDLTADVYSDAGGHSFTIDNASEFDFYALEPGTNNFSAIEGYSGFTGITALNGATNGQASISANAGDGDVPNFAFHSSVVGSGNRGCDWIGQSDGYNMLNTHDNPKGRKSIIEQFATDSITGHRFGAYHTNGYNRFSITDTLFKFERRRSDLANLDFRLINLPPSSSKTDSVLVKDDNGRIYSRSQSDISVTPGGSDGNVQINNAGALGGSSALNFDAINNILQLSSNGTTDNGAIVIHHPTEGDSWYSHSNIGLHNSDAVSQPGISISNNLNKTLNILNPGGVSDPGIFAEDSLQISAARRFDIAGGKLVLRGRDSLLMQVTPSVTADSLLGVVGFNELYKTNKIVKFPKPREFVHWSQWLSGNIGSTNFELSCLREGAGSVTIPKNTALTGDTYRITMIGDVTTDATTPGQTVLRIKLGDQIVATTNALEFPAGLNQRAFELDVIVVLWIPGSSGIAYARGFWRDESGSIKRCDIGINIAVCDFSKDLNWDITAQWNNSATGNAFRPFIVSIVQEN